jgi:hypothetical protein
MPPTVPSSCRPALRRRALAPLAAALALAAAPGAAAAQSYGGYDEYTARRDAEVDARGARRVEVEGRAGTLRVVGVGGLGAVRVRGVARASRREWLADLRVVARRDGDVVVVRADIPDWRDTDHHGGWDGGGTRALDLVVEVPRGIDAEVVDGSGDAEVRGVGALVARDGSGDFAVEDAASVDVADGSGTLRVRGVRGDVRVEDGSGDIDVDRVDGAVVVARDGSGGVDVRAVRGDLVVERRRASGITYADVRGRVRVPAPRRERWRDW